MHIKLMEPVELDGIEYPAGKVLKVSRAAGVELLKDQVAVPAPPGTRPQCSRARRAAQGKKEEQDRQDCIDRVLVEILENLSRFTL